MKDFTYSLDKSSKKLKCPGCGQKRFVVYVNVGTKEILMENVGRCDRESSCGYHYTPKQYFNDNNIQSVESETFKPRPTEPVLNLPIACLPFELMERSVTLFYKCNLFPFFKRLFHYEVSEILFSDYLIGASKSGDTIFWQVDRNLKVRQAKVIKYDPGTGKRDKRFGAYFLGKKILTDDDANLQQCFFGEQLLYFPENHSKPIAIVESEKTAVIASVFYPDYLWLATGGKHGARWTEQAVCKVLAGRSVILFPDLGAFESWKAKGLLIAAVAGCKVVVSDLLEQLASDQDKAQGLDLADYLLRLDDSSGLAMADGPYPVIWDYPLKKFA